MFIRALKAFVKRPFLIMVPAVFSLFLLFFLIQGNNNKPVLQSILSGQVANKVSSGLPVRLMIPEININAGIQYLGITPNGEMEVPSNTVDVGWFKFGPHPGEKGSAVIAGHFDGGNSETGVFANLYKLKKGDKLYIIDDKGKSITFVVRESRIFDPGYAEEVFGLNDSAHLNLVTCDGVWDGIKKSYSKRLVVFTDTIN